MKITKEHIEYLRREMMKSGSTPTLHSYRRLGLSEKEWRWDWLHNTPGLTEWICNNIFAYANDDDLDIVLKKITRGEL